VEPRGETRSDKGVARETEPRRPARRIAIHAGAALVTIAFAVGLTFAFVFVDFVTSVCGTATAHEVRTYRLALVGYAVLLTFIPLAVGMVIRRVGERSWPWFALAAIVALVAAIGTPSAQPSHWCF
jgi:uncharacterized membrane protein